MEWLWSIIKAIPAIISLVNQIIKAAKGDPTGTYIKDSGKAFKKLNRAKSTDEKRAAAKDLQNLITKL